MECADGGRLHWLAAQVLHEKLSKEIFIKNQSAFCGFLFRVDDSFRSTRLLSSFHTRTAQVMFSHFHYHFQLPTFAIIIVVVFNMRKAGKAI